MYTTLSFVMRTLLIQTRTKVLELATKDKASESEKITVVEDITRLFAFLDLAIGKSLNSEPVKERFIIVKPNGKAEEIKQGGVEEISVNDLSDILIDMKA
jgi:hypothetical protein